MYSCKQERDSQSFERHLKDQRRSHPKKEVGLSTIPLIPINLIDSSPTSPYLFVFAIVTLFLIATKQIEFRECTTGQNKEPAPTQPCCLSSLPLRKKTRERRASGKAPRKKDLRLHSWQGESERVGKGIYACLWLLFWLFIVSIRTLVFWLFIV